MKRYEEKIMSELTHLDKNGNATLRYSNGSTSPIFDLGYASDVTAF